jgi:hypothetical protein
MVLHVRSLDVSLPQSSETSLNVPGIFEQMLRSMMKHVEACIEFCGGHFEHLYKCTLSAVTHRLNVSGHMLIWTFFFSCFCMWNSCPKFLCTFQLHPILWTLTRLLIQYNRTVTASMGPNCLWEAQAQEIPNLLWYQNQQSQQGRNIFEKLTKKSFLYYGPQTVHYWDCILRQLNPLHPLGTCF